MNMSAFRTNLSLAIVSLLGFATLALADGPAALSRVEGVIVHNSSSVSSLNFVEGERSNCELTSNGLSVTRCNLAGSSARLVSANNAEATISFNRLSYFATNSGNKVLHQYFYVGVWSTTLNGKSYSAPATITFLQYSDMDPSELRGYLTIEDFDISEQLKGTIKP